MTGTHGKGLGRGLAGILGDAMGAQPGTGVNELLGGDRARRSPVVRELVTQLALRSIADGFDADGVVLVRRDSDGELAAVTSQLPSSWDGFDTISFEVSGRLWNKLDDAGHGVEQVELGQHAVLICHDASPEGTIAAAVVRPRPFGEAERATVGQLVRSVGAALNGDDVLPTDRSVRVLIQESGDGVLADVRLTGAGDRRHAASVADTSPLAVARAASELCDDQLIVEFAGDTTVDGFLVTIVVIKGPDGGPLFGLCVTDPGATNGPAIAVFSAARVLGLDPFAGLHDASSDQPSDG